MTAVTDKRAWTPGLVTLFAAIQVASILLTLVGIPLIAVLAFLHLWWCDAEGRYHWPRIFRLWDNQEDGICAKWYCDPITAWGAFKWSALRNSANNLRYVRGVSDVSRPLWRWTWGAKPGGLYAMAGWNNSGFPVLSGGRNVNAY